MPYYRRGYSRRGRYGYGYRGYNRGWRRRGWFRRGGLARASTQGNRRFSVVVPTQSVFNFTVGAGTYWSDLFAVCPYSAAGSKLQQAALPSSLLYRTYTRLYDQVKIDWVSVKLSIMSLVGAGGVAPAVKVVTMWDRDFTAQATDAITVDKLQNGSESQTSLVVNNSRAVMSRFNGASDIQERTTFHDCSLSIEGSGSTYYADNAWFYGHDVGYSPGLFMALNTATSPGTGSSFVFTCSLDVKWHVTFRNPKFGLTSEGGSSKTVADLASEPVAVKAAGKSVSFDAGAVSDVLPTYTGLLGDAVDRLAAGMEDPGVYDNGEYNIKEDVEFAYGKLGDEKFHEVFKDNYDLILREIGLISDVSKEA